MTGQSKLASNSYSLTSIYIPRVHRNQMREAYVKRVFECQHIAIVSRVDFVEYEHPDANFCFAVVHVLFWIPGVISKHFRERIQSQREARIVFSDPSYWVVLPYTQKQKKASLLRAEASLETYSTPPTPISSYTFAPAPFAPAPTKRNQNQNQNCICGCGGYELDCSSQILYNSFTDSTWKTTTATTPTNVSSSSWNNMEENFRFYDHDDHDSAYSTTAAY